MLRKLKSLVDRTANETTQLQSDLVKLEQKGYPQQMTEWCNAKVVTMKGFVATAQAVYNDEVTKPSSGAVDALQAEGRRLDEALKLLETNHTEWKKTAGAEIRKLIG